MDYGMTYCNIADALDLLKIARKDLKRIENKTDLEEIELHFLEKSIKQAKKTKKNF